MIRRELRLDVPGQRLNVRRIGDRVLEILELGDEVRLVGDPLSEPDALETLHEDPQRPVGHLDHLVHERCGADLVEVVPPGLLGLGVLDGHERQHPLACDDVVDQLDRALLADGERRHRLGEDHGLLQREHREARGQLGHRGDFDESVERCGSPRGLGGVALAHPLIRTTIAIGCGRAGRSAIGSLIVSSPRS